MNERNEQLKSLIQNGRIGQAIKMVQTLREREREDFVFTVLGEDKSTPKLVEEVLEAFRNTRDGRHGAWVHGLSHITEILWERRIDGWIKKFNEVAFKGAVELDDSNCCDRLVADFAKYSKWNDDPADFALTPENLVWMDSVKYLDYAKARIEEGRFKSEEDFLRWKLRRPETHFAFDYDAQSELVNIENIRSLIQKLQELSADVSEFKAISKDLLIKQLNELEGRLQAETCDWRRKGLEKAIQKTRLALNPPDDPTPTPALAVVAEVETPPKKTSVLSSLLRFIVKR